VLAAVVAVGALLRFATLDVQHFWLDEAVTAGLLQLDVDDMIGVSWTTESTPPLYYLVARGWAEVFGTGEIGLRSLSALAGTLTIPVVYAIGATLASRRAGLVAAALTAVSPALVWYSQEARSYALVILLSALSLLFVARALSGSGRDVAWWALSASLALLTHYFAVFLVAGEAIWLLAAYPRRRTAALGIAAVGACGAALLPLAIHQSGQGNLDFIGDISLGTRVVDTAQLFLAGPTGDRLDLALALVAIGAALAVAAGVRMAARERRSALVLAALGLSGVAAPVVLALAGADYVLARNLLPLWVPLAAAVAIGLGTERAGRLGVGAAAALALGSLWLLVAVPLDPELQREAITAELTGSRIDSEEERVDPHVDFALGDAGTTISTRADCDEGYHVGTGGAAVRHGNEATTVVARETTVESGSALGQRATEEVESDGTVLQVYAVCVRPRD
jgi:predicted membrane-bound mannosyltransferase